MENGGHPITGSIRCSINSTRCFKLALRVQNEAAPQHNFIDKRPDGPVLSEWRPLKLLANIDSRASFDFDFKHDSLLTTRSQRLFFRLASRALLAPIGGSFVSQTTLPNGFFTKNYGRPSLLVPQPCRLQTLLVKVQLFSEVVRRAMKVYLAAVILTRAT